MNRAQALRILGRYGTRNYLDVTPKGFQVTLLEIKRRDGIAWDDVEPFLQAVQYLINNPPPEKKRHTRRRTRK